MTTVSIKNRAYVFGEACRADLPKIVAIYNEGIGTANADFAPVSVESREPWFLAHGGKRPLFVLKDGDEVVAWASLSNLYDRPAYLHATEISVYVTGEYHGLGLGAFLVEKLLECAKSLEVTRVAALIFGHNHASLSLFKKAGFSEWGVLPKVCLSQGVPSDVVILGIALD